LGCHRGILEQQSALEKLTTVKARAEDEMPMEKGAGLFEKGEDVSHWGRGVRLWAIGGADQVWSDEINFVSYYQVSGLEFHPSSFRCGAPTKETPRF
jgi:hypothetical protein